MPDETKEVQVITEDVIKNLLGDKLTVEVPRNEKSCTFHVAPIRKGKNDTGLQRYALAPVEAKTPEEKQKFIEWVGAPVYDFLLGKVRLLSQQITKLAAENQQPGIEGKDFISLFIDYISKLSSRGDTYQSLYEERDRIEDEMKILGDDLTLSPIEKSQKVLELIVKLSEVRDAIAFKDANKRGSSDDE